jgi:hypothetical protein
MEENKAYEELLFIKQIIEESKRELVYNGIDYIVWGVLVFIGLITTYVTYTTDHILGDNIVWMVWFGIVAAGYLFGYFNGKKEERIMPPTFLRRSISALWTATGISMMILGFVAPISNNHLSLFICPFLSTVLGLAYYVTGFLVASKQMKYLSFGWWAGAVIMFVKPGFYTLLLMAFMMLVLQTIPGILIYIKYIKEKKAGK